MASLRSPLALFVGFLVFVTVPLVAMWVSVGEVGLLLRLGGFAVYFLVAHVALPAWVYLDARRADTDATLAWTVLAFFVPLLGVAAYLLLGRNRVDAAPSE